MPWNRSAKFECLPEKGGRKSTCRDQRTLFSAGVGATRGVRLVCLLILLSCIGCSCTSIRYVDNEGNSRIIGLVSLKYTPSKGSGDLSRAEIGGMDLEVKTIGLSVLSSPIGSGVALGYSGERIVMLEDNVAVGKLPEKFNEERESDEN